VIGVKEFKMTAGKQQTTKLPAGDMIGASILIVEDSPSQALRFVNSLESNGCRVHWAINGNDGIQATKNESFDLIILDIELPDIDGFEICRRLKADPTVKNTPIIMLTTHDRAKDVITGLASGAIDYIPKDEFAELVLLETLRQMKLG
jgi:DNA-binding response OmpR family regulator